LLEKQLSASTVIEDRKKRKIVQSNHHCLELKEVTIIE